MSTTLTRIHSDTMRLPTYKLVRLLNKNLGTTLVAFLANVKSRQIPNRWATDPSDPQHIEPRDEAKQRLQLAYQAFKAISEAEDNEHVARSWLIGANPRFDGDTPAQKIREYAVKEIYTAVKDFIDDTGGA